MKTNLTLQKLTEISVIYDEKFATYIASFGEFAVITFRERKILYTVNLRTSLTKEVEIPFEPRVICTHPDGSLLVSSTENALFKLRISTSGDLSVTWSCQDLHSAYGICVMDNGLIIVNTNYAGFLYVVSQAGM